MQKVVDHKLCSIKQAQAYSRTLAFDDISKDEAQVYYDKMLNGDTKAYLPVQDYIMHAICRYANDIKIPYQIHTAMTNLPISNPVNLTNLFTIYGDVKFVLLHGFPYINETAFLASRYDNVYIDIAWLGLQSRDILFDALMKYIGFVPNNKICISGDATSLEEFCGITIINREVAAKVLNEKIKRGSLNKTQSIKIAKKIFKKNAKMIYKI